MELVSHSPTETKKTAQNLVSFLETQPARCGATVVGLYGDLGSGKTTFTQFFGELLGIEETIASPTFVIQKVYKIGADIPGNIAAKFSHLIHIDAYRLDSEKEMETLGWKNIVTEPRNLILVEWPERIAKLLPPDHIKIFFEHVGGDEEGSENSRKIKIEHARL